MIRAVLTRWKPAILAGLALVGLAPAGAQALEKAPVSLAADSWAPNDDDSWLFDVRSGQYRLGDGVRGSKAAMELISKADVVLALDLAVRVDKKLRRATGWVFDERRSLTIDRDAGEVRAGSQSFRLSPTMIRDTPAGWCVDLNSLTAGWRPQSRVAPALQCAAAGARRFMPPNAARAAGDPPGGPIRSRQPAAGVAAVSGVGDAVGRCRRLGRIRVGQARRILCSGPLRDFRRG